MDGLTTSDPRVSKAVVVWTGYGNPDFMCPLIDDERVVERFRDLAVDLMPLVRRLYDPFYDSDARHAAADLVDMGERAIAEFRSVHPEVSGEAVEALAWCYTYDFK